MVPMCSNLIGLGAASKTLGALKEKSRTLVPAMMKALPGHGNAEGISCEVT